MRHKNYKGYKPMKAKASQVLTEYLATNWEYITLRCRHYAKDEYEDLRSEVYEKMCKYIHRFDPSTGEVGFRKWASFIIRNAYFDEYRSIVKQPFVVDIELVFELNDHDSRIINYEHRDILAKAYRVLRKQMSQKLTITLYLINQGYSYEETADILHTNVNTIKGRIRRCRIFLLTYFGEQHNTAHTLIKKSQKLAA